MDRIFLNDLYDLYKELLTDKEKLVFEDYYQNDLSLSEISENENVTRNAIHKTLKNVEGKLVDYETKLKLYDKRTKLLKAIDNNDIKSIEKLI